MLLIPSGERVVLKEIPQEQRISGIYIPTNTDRHYYKGIVVAVGTRLLPSGERIPLDVDVNDVVYYDKTSCYCLEEDGVKYYVVLAQSILAKVV